MFVCVCFMFAKGLVLWIDLTEGWYIREKSLEMYICLRPEFDCPEATLCGWQDIKIQLLLLLLLLQNWLNLLQLYPDMLVTLLWRTDRHWKQEGFLIGNCNPSMFFSFSVFWWRPNIPYSWSSLPCWHLLHKGRISYWGLFCPSWPSPFLHASQFSTKKVFILKQSDSKIVSSIIMPQYMTCCCTHNWPTVALINNMC